jgi:fido (protein-threonine AMPylation protein)
MQAKRKQKKYRIETNYSHNKPISYIVKDVKYKNRRTKVRIRVGRYPPATAAEKIKLGIKYAYDLEAMAAEKRAELSSTFYTSKYLTREGITNVEKVRHYYRAFKRLLTPSEVAVYEKAFEINYIQGTTNIEGNTITRNQAFDLLINNIAPDGKSLREINEVQNFKKVIVFREKYKGKVTMDFIKTLHSLIMSNIDMESAGVFRRIDDVFIAGCELTVKPSILIKKELKELIENYYKRLDADVHPFEAAVLFHYGFEMIHPFTDGNGRVGREIFNYMLKKCGYPRLLFLGTDREIYIKSLKLGNQDNYADMIQLFVDLIMKQQYYVLVKTLKDVVNPIRKEQPTLDMWFNKVKG